MNNTEAVLVDSPQLFTREELENRGILKRVYANKYQNPEYKGEDLPNYIQNGPPNSRSCTDCLWLLIFIMASTGFTLIAQDSYQTGSLEKLSYVSDVDGNLCGVSKDFEDYPYAYLSNPQKNIRWAVCVQKCPNENDKQINSLMCKPNSVIQSCQNNNNLKIYNSFLLFGRVCIPQNNPEKEVTLDVFEYKWIYDIYHDLAMTWDVILIVAGISAVLGFIFMFSLKYCPGVFTWMFLGIFIGGMVGFGFIMWTKADKISEDIQQNKLSNNTDGTVTMYRAVAILLWMFSAISFIVIIMIYEKISLAVALAKSASIFIQEVGSSVLIPPIIFLLFGIFTAIFGFTLIQIYTSNPIDQSDIFPLKTFDLDPKHILYMIYTVLFGWWSISLLFSINIFIIATAVCAWYFKQTKHGPIRTGIWYSFRYHFGTLVFGSLLLSLFSVAISVLGLVTRIVKSLEKKQNKGEISNFLIDCCRCFVNCNERFLMFIDKYAYIQVAILGEGFCDASKRVHYIFKRNSKKFAATSGLGEIYIFTGRYSIAMISTIIGYIYLNNSSTGVKDQLSSIIIPLIVQFIISLVIVSLLLNLHEIGLEAILNCFLIEEEIRAKNKSNQNNCPDPLKEFLREIRNEESQPIIKEDVLQKEPEIF